MEQNMPYWFRKPLKNTEAIFFPVFHICIQGIPLTANIIAISWLPMKLIYYSLGLWMTKLQEPNGLLNEKGNCKHGFKSVHKVLS